MKVSWFLILLISITIFCMESKQKVDKYDRFKTAILAQNELEINKLLKFNIDTNVVLENGMDCITFALKNNKVTAAHFIADALHSRIHTLESAFISPFQKAAETNDVELLEKVMQLKMPEQQKKIGCNLAFTIACGKNYLPIVEELTKYNDKYLENPCKSIAFQRIAIGFPEDHAKIVQHILKRPQAVSELVDMISKKDFAYPDEIEKYKKLLAQAQQLFFDQYSFFFG